MAYRYLNYQLNAQKAGSVAQGEQGGKICQIAVPHDIGAGEEAYESREIGKIGKRSSQTRTPRCLREAGGLRHGGSNVRQVPRRIARNRGRISIWVPDGSGIFSGSRHRAERVRRFGWDRGVG